MNEATRRLLFLLLFAVVFFQTGVHVSQAFINYPAWGFIGRDSFPEYHRVMTGGARAFGLLPRVVELVLAIAADPAPQLKAVVRRRFLLPGCNL